MSKQRIGFIGVGLMGSSMSKHLMEAGFQVIVHDTDPIRVAAAVKLGAKTVKSPERTAMRRSEATALTGSVAMLKVRAMG